MLLLKAVVTTTIRLRFDGRSTTIRHFDCLIKSLRSRDVTRYSQLRLPICSNVVWDHGLF